MEINNCLDLNDIVEGADDFVLVKKEENPFERIYYLESKKKSELCPECNSLCTKTKTRYTRRIKHGVRDGKEIILILKVHQFICENSKCKTKSFSESVAFAEKWQQRSKEMNRTIIVQAAQNGFRGTEAVLNQTGISISHSSVRRQFSRVKLKEKKELKFIGIDDVANLKGKNYMTIIYDGFSHEPVKLLNGRSSQEIVDFIKEHPEIQAAARDRSTFYADTLRNCLPDCVQVADRFHLIQNANHKVKEYLLPQLDKKLFFNGNRRITEQEFKRLSPRKFQSYKKHPKVMAQKAMEESKREELFLSKLSPNINYDSWFGASADSDILENKKRLNCSEPEAQTIKSTTNDIDYTSVQQKLPASGLRSFSRKDIIRFITTNRSKKSKEIEEIFPILCEEFPCLVEAQEFSQRFYKIIMGNNPDDLDDFFNDYITSPVDLFKGFARGLRSDMNAIKNSIRYKNISSGFVEGSNNLLKLIKRKGYGNLSVESLDKLFKLNFKLYHSSFQLELQPVAQKEYYSRKTKKKSRNSDF